MQLRELRRVLQQIVLAGLPAACSSGNLPSPFGPVDCVKKVEQTITVNHPEPPMALRVESCRVDVDACAELCSYALAQSGESSAVIDCNVQFVDGNAEVKVSYDVPNGTNCPTAGRQPVGLAAPRHGHAQSPAGAWLAHAAWLEAASVHAFVQLAGELVGHGAPDRLVRAALAAAADEVCHAEVVGRLAARYGAQPSAVSVAPARPRSLEALAVENAAEGCVRETWGAVVAMWQARTAADPEVRAAFAGIAADETRHAALAWAVDAWVRTRLADDAHARIDAARAAAAAELVTASDAVGLVALGLPHANHARALLARTHAQLWTGGHS